MRRQQNPFASKPKIDCWTSWKGSDYAQLELRCLRSAKGAAENTPHSPDVGIDAFPRGNLSGPHPANSKLHEKVVPAKPAQDEPTGKTADYGQGWAQRLKRVFAIEIEKCEKCGGKMNLIACIEEPAIIEEILKHLGLDQSNSLHNLQHTRAPPGGALASVTTLL